jgi:hypothetical protein
MSRVVCHPGKRKHSGNLPTALGGNHKPLTAYFLISLDYTLNDYEHVVGRMTTSEHAIPGGKINSRSVI